jgi:AraC-like DNA-binding protein
MPQGRLPDSECEYSQVLAEVRFEAALRLMDDPSLRVIDVACELGYNDPSNFTRAFRRWTGVSPEGFVGCDTIGTDPQRLRAIKSF